MLFRKSGTLDVNLVVLWHGPGEMISRHDPIREKIYQLARELFFSHLRTEEFTAR